MSRGCPHLDINQLMAQHMPSRNLLMSCLAILLCPSSTSRTQAPSHDDCVHAQARTLLSQAKGMLRTCQQRLQASRAAIAQSRQVAHAASIDPSVATSAQNAAQSSAEQLSQAPSRTSHNPRNSSQPGMSHSTRQDDEDDGFELCAICMECAVDTIFMPCRHTVTCSACAKRVMQRTAECPMCRCQLSGTPLISEMC